MNAEDIIKALRYCYSKDMVRGCNGCPYHDREDDTCTTENLELQAADLIESLQAQLERFNATLAREGFTELETMIAKYKTVMLAANELSIETDEEIEALREQLKESQRRERAAIKDIKSYHSCRQCKHHVPNEKPWCVGSCKSTPTGTNCENWEWRGLKEGGL